MTGLVSAWCFVAHSWRRWVQRGDPDGEEFMLCLACGLHWPMPPQAP